MITPYQLSCLLPKPKDEIEIIVDRQDTDDIMNGIFEMHNEQVANYNKLANFICSKLSVFEIPGFIFDFCKKYFTYKEDSFKTQDLKSPQIILRDRIVDCKCYSLFIGGILNSCNNVFRKKYFDIFYTFTSYDDLPEPTHIFVICNNEVIDPCLDYFNQIKVCQYIYTYKISNNMAVRKITGLKGGNEFSNLVDPSLLSHIGDGEGGEGYSGGENDGNHQGGGDQGGGDQGGGDQGGGDQGGGDQGGGDQGGGDQGGGDQGGGDQGGGDQGGGDQGGEGEGEGEGEATKDSNGKGGGGGGGGGGKGGGTAQPQKPAVNPAGDTITAPSIKIVAKTAKNCTIDVIVPTLNTASALGQSVPPVVTILSATGLTAYTGNGKGVVLKAGNYSIFYTYANNLLKVVKSNVKNVVITVSSTPQTPTTPTNKTSSTTSTGVNTGLLLLAVGAGAYLILKK